MKNKLFLLSFLFILAFASIVNGAETQLLNSSQWEVYEIHRMTGSEKVVNVTGGGFNIFAFSTASNAGGLENEATFVTNRSINLKNLSGTGKTLNLTNLALSSVYGITGDRDAILFITGYGLTNSTGDGRFIRTAIVTQTTTGTTTHTNFKIRFYPTKIEYSTNNFVSNTSVALLASIQSATKWGLGFSALSRTNTAGKTNSANISITGIQVPLSSWNGGAPPAPANVTHFDITAIDNETLANINTFNATLNNFVLNCVQYKPNVSNVLDSPNCILNFNGNITYTNVVNRPTYLNQNYTNYIFLINNNTQNVIWTIDKTDGEKNLTLTNDCLDLVQNTGILNLRTVHQQTNTTPINNQVKAYCLDNTYSWIQLDASGSTGVMNIISEKIRFDGDMFFSTTNGTINTGINSTAGLSNITIQTPNYHTKIYENYNLSVNLNSLLNRKFYFFAPTYSSYITYNTTKYTKNLSVSLNLSCLIDTNTSIGLYENGVFKQDLPVTCTGEFINPSFRYVSATEGLKYINIKAENLYYPANYSINTSFTYDLYAPNASVNIKETEGLNQSSTIVSLYCTDNIAPILEYDLNFNSNNIYFNNKTEGSNQTNTRSYINGNNTAFGICSDLFYSTNDTDTLFIYKQILQLIDEIDKTNFNPSSLKRVRAYWGNTTYWDFKALSTSYLNYSLIDDTKIRIELAYNDGNTINRYIDTSLFGGQNNIRVCANKENITHYEQTILSSLVRPAVIENTFTNCLVAGDYTRFAYQDALSLTAYTIPTNYHLKTNDEDDNLIYLASVDGAIASYINLDTLEFSQTTYGISILSDLLTFQHSQDEEVKIYYKNQKDDNEEVTINIYNQDTHALVFTDTITTQPNEFNLYFNYATLNNVSEMTLFKIELEKTTSLGVSTLSKYFKGNGKAGFFNSTIIAVVALGLLIVGFTITATKTTFSWFGVLICLACMALCSLAIQEWYIIFIETISLIVLVYTIINLTQKEYGEIA